MKKDYVVDTETDALVGYTKLWCIVFREVETDEVTIFRNVHDDNGPCRAFMDSCVRHYIGHNFINFDYDVIRHFLGFDIQPDAVLDTLVISKLLNYNRKGGHSLENWGDFYKMPKDPCDDFTQWSPELEARCVQDTAINRRMWQDFSKYYLTKRWRDPILLELHSAFNCKLIKSNGFKINTTKLNNLFSQLNSRKQELDSSITSAFPNLNVNSPKQRVDVLRAAGWKPVNKTKGHIAELRKGKEADQEKLDKYAVYGWTTDEENLATLPEEAPEAAKSLTEALLVNSRLGDLTEWKTAVDPVSGRIHPTINGIGSWTHRKSHQDPNSANIPALINRKGKPQPYGAEMRELWEACQGWKLVGTDAAGIQLRVFAHYVNDPKLTKSIVEGKKEDGTDIHSINRGILGDCCKGREPAKTYIYAKFLGAALPKIAEILSCSRPEASAADKRILEYYPGWARLKRSQIPADAKRGYFTGLDGRYVFVPSEHHVLAGYLQNGESVIMKLANKLWVEELNKLGVPYRQVNDVHDEWQTETPPEFAKQVGEIQVQAIRDAGVILNLNCPLDGEYKIGDNWKETH